MNKRLTEYTSYEDIIEEYKDNNVKAIVFGGFSGQGYSNETEFRAKLKQDLLDILIEENEAQHIAIVCGATSDGIGVIYSILAEIESTLCTSFADMGKYDANKIRSFTSLGIVSEQAKQYGIDDNCNSVFYVKDYDSSWKVLSPNGESYMVKIAEDTGGYLQYYGGGNVAKQEMLEAMLKGVKVNYIDWQPKN